MAHLRRLISIANLRRRRTGRRGQVATIMLLGVVGVLTFVFMTANLGYLSVHSTRVANAADSSALLLGSQLASKSRVLWESMDQKTKRCVKGGALGIVLAIIAAAIAVAITWCSDGCVTAMIVAGAVAGAVGGAIGGAITGGGNGALMGAIQGAMLGAAIGAGVGAVTNLVGALATAPTTTGAAGSAAGSGAASGGTSSAAALDAAALDFATTAGIDITGGAASGGTAATTGVAAETATVGAAGTEVGGVSIVGETVPAATAPASAAPATTAPAATAPTAGSGSTSNALGVIGKGSTVGPHDVGLMGTEVAVVSPEVIMAGGTPAQATSIVSVAPYTPIGSATGGLSGTLVGGFALTPQAAVAVTGTNFALQAGSSLYVSSVQDQIKSDVLSRVAELLNGLPESHQFRENTFFQALVQTVDDPTTVPDLEDMDEDGNTGERIPVFQAWWAVRGAQLQGMVRQLRLLIEALLSPTGIFAAFTEVAQNTFTPISATTPGILARKEIEGQKPGVPELLRDKDGLVVEFLRALRDAGNGVSFWQPGPTLQMLSVWHEQDQDDCSACAPPPAYDDVDFAVDTYQDFAKDAADLRESIQDDVGTAGLDNLVSTWETWSKLFFDPDPTNQDDYFDLFDNIVGGGNGLVGIRGWQAEIEEIRRDLPVCQLSPPTCVPGGDGVCVPEPPTLVESPCRGPLTTVEAEVPDIPETGGSVDDDLDDEFTSVQNELSALIFFTEAFRNRIEQFYLDMTAAQNTLRPEHGGNNPITYEWIDSRGPHSVRVTVGPFKLARITKEKPFNMGFLYKKICLILKDYSSGETGMPATVTITRRDPVKELGLWRWNPHGGEITKTCRVSYSYDSVGMAGVQ